MAKRFQALLLRNWWFDVVRIKERSKNITIKNKLQFNLLIETKK